MSERENGLREWRTVSYTHLKYENARDDFGKQLKAVLELQDQLKGICAIVRKREDLIYKQNGLEIKLTEKRTENNRLIEAENLNLDRLQEILKQKDKDVRLAKGERDKIESHISEISKEVEALSSKKREQLEKEVDARKSTGVFSRLFNKQRCV